MLILGRPTNAVHSVWVNGKQIVSEGKVKTIDVDELRQQLFEHSEWNSKRQSQTVSEFGINRSATVLHQPGISCQYLVMAIELHSIVLLYTVL